MSTFLGISYKILCWAFLFALVLIPIYLLAQCIPVFAMVLGWVRDVVVYVYHEPLKSICIALIIVVVLEFAKGKK
jgi:hypothetical protein